MSNNMKRIKKTSRLVDNKIMIVKKNYISNIYIIDIVNILLDIGKLL